MYPCCACHEEFEIEALSRIEFEPNRLEWMCSECLVSGGVPPDLDGYMDLDLLSDYQFVMNEIAIGSGVSYEQYYELEQTDISNRTLTGTVYNEGVAIQTFIDIGEGFLSFTAVEDEIMAYRVVRGHLDLEAGFINLDWTTYPGENHIVVSYEYSLEENGHDLRKREEESVNWLKEGF